jgi:predicted AlkP superfamily phosphohydrolase/phosphomutase
MADKLENMIDPATGKRCCRRVAVSHSYFDGPYRFDAPDLLVGWEGGYRYSWECAVGQVTAETFSDNTRSWSGDHCVHPDVVPGVFFCNRAISQANPRLIDIPATVMRLFGQEIPSYMQGQMILPEGADAAAGGAVKGMIDPTTLDQRGAAPGALVFPPEDRKASGQS